jgi:hypothetical protein
MDLVHSLSRADVVDVMRESGQSSHHDWDPETGPWLLGIAAELPQSAESLSALATAYRAQQLVAEALKTLDEAMLALADALER